MRVALGTPFAVNAAALVFAVFVVSALVFALVFARQSARRDNRARRVYTYAYTRVQVKAARDTGHKALCPVSTGANGFYAVEMKSQNKAAFIAAYPGATAANETYLNYDTTKKHALWDLLQLYGCDTCIGLARTSVRRYQPP